MNVNSVLIVEDNLTTMQWLKDCIERAFSPNKILLANSVLQAKNAICSSLDIAIIDLHLPDGNGVDVLKDISKNNRDTMCIVATIFDDDEHLFPALQAGAAGYLLKDQSKTQFIQSLSGIVDGNPPLSPAIARRLMSHFKQPNLTEAVKITPREQDVLRLIGQGLQVKKIALELDISHHTVSDHIKTLYRKLSISSRAEAAVEAIKRGLV